MHDYIVIGSGIAGLFTALLASRHGSVLVLTKAALEESNTRYAQGGIAAAMSPGDSPRLHFEDTIASGVGLCDERAVEVLTREAPARIRDLMALNVPFDRTGSELALGLEGAHRARRVLHAGGDATGFHIEQTLCRALRSAGVEVIEGCFVTEIVTEKGRVVGVRSLSDKGVVEPGLVDDKVNCGGRHGGGGREGVQETRLMPGKHVVLASGGAGQVFSHTTNPAVATGDGLALAYRAGAAVADIEFYQFHPTALAVPGLPSFLISEAVRGEGAYLRNADGERFMLRVDPRGELAPRDIVARAISDEMLRTATTHVFLDLNHLPHQMVARRFPTILAYCAKAGLDLTSDPLPVAPAAHYSMGGVQTNLWGETSVPGLYACGEVACTGVHGANRLASNSLLEGLVFGARIVAGIIDGGGRETAQPEDNALRITRAATVYGDAGRVEKPTLAGLQALMWKHAGLVRDEEGLSLAQTELTRWKRALPKPRSAADHELKNMILIGRLMTSAAIERRESRGGHCRADFPKPDPRWQRHIVLSKGSAARSARETR
jgi:L-aspartate oxidase